jgi:hypothetical protein
LCWAIQPPKSFRKRFDPISLSPDLVKEMEEKVQCIQHNFREAQS